MPEYRPPLTMRYGMPQPTSAQQTAADARKEAWLDSLRTARQMAIEASVRGIGRQSIDAAAFNGAWKRPVIKV